MDYARTRLLIVSIGLSKLGQTLSLDDPEELGDLIIMKVWRARKTVSEALLIA